MHFGKAGLAGRLFNTQMKRSIGPLFSFIAFCRAPLRKQEESKATFQPVGWMHLFKLEIYIQRLSENILIVMHSV